MSSISFEMGRKVSVKRSNFSSIVNVKGGSCQANLPVALTLFGLGGKMPPLRIFAKYLKNGLANLHDTL